MIGVFFSEIGTELLASFSSLDPDLDRLRRDLAVRESWAEHEFRAAMHRLGSYCYRVQPASMDLEWLRTYMHGKRDFPLLLMENPNLVEHERFTELLLTPRPR